MRIAFEAVWERDLRNEAVQWDASFESIFGYPRGEVGNCVSWWRERVHPDDIENVEEVVARAIRDGAAGWSNEYRFRRRDGSWAWVRSRCVIERDASGDARRAAGAMMDISSLNDDVTERARAEDALRKTERLLLEAEQLGQTGSWEHDFVSGELFNTEANRRLFFGDDRSKGEQLEAEDYILAVHPDDRERVMAARRQLHAGAGSRDIEFRIVRPDGDVRWIFGRATIVRDASGHPLRAYGTHADITERKHAEEELGRRTQQLEVLSRKLIEAQEAERRAVARELHDDFGQVLTALKLNLHQRGRDDTESIELIDGAIVRMRELAQGLRPPLLDEFGLEASLKWYVQREGKRSGLAFELDFAPLDRRAETVVETTCFRVVQEALTNVIRHADAHLVKIQLSERNGDLQLSFCDDGRGFDVAAARKRSNQDGNQGLLNMQERVALAGGDFEIESAPGRGTCVRARLPLAGAKKERAE
jgi:two-component system sensor histidine kinase UhpB